MHFGVGMPDRSAVVRMRDRLLADGVELVEFWDEPAYIHHRGLLGTGRLRSLLAQGGSAGEVRLVIARHAIANAR
jgi:hypothetical protein